MADRDKLVDYIKDGLNKGFSRRHIKDVLLKHQYTNAEVDMAFALAERRHKRRKLDLKPLMPFAYVTATVFVMLILFAVLVQSDKEKPSALMAVQRETIESQIKEIDTLKSSIDQQQSEISMTLETIKSMDISLEEKEILVNEQIKKLEDVNYQMLNERQKIRNLLLSVVNSMFRRSAAYLGGD